MISLIVDTEHVQEMFIACHTKTVYWPNCAIKKSCWKMQSLYSPYISLCLVYFEQRCLRI